MFKNNRFCDRYYPGLLEELSESEKRDVYFSPELLIHRYRDLRRAIWIADKAQEQFLFRIDYLKVIDYLFALLGPIRINRIRFEDFQIFGFRVGPILKSHFRKNVLNWSSVAGLLNYRFFKRLKESGVQLRKVIDWNENQVVDRGFNKGLKDYYPNCPNVGYQGYIVSSDFNFYIHPTKYEYDAGVVPEEIAVVGKGLIQNAKRFFERLKVDVAPAFRFSSVWKEEYEDIDAIGSKIILVALPISVRESEEIIRLIIDALSIRKHNGLRFNIKQHPALDMEELKKKLGQEWCKEFSFVSGDFTKRVKECCLMLGNTSSSCVETLALGIPVIVIGSQSGLTQNSIPKTVRNKFWRLVYTPQELQESIDYFIENNESLKSAFKDNARIMRETYFEKVTSFSVRHFLGFQ